MKFRTMNQFYKTFFPRWYAEQQRKREEELHHWKVMSDMRREIREGRIEVPQMRERGTEVYPENDPAFMRGFEAAQRHYRERHLTGDGHEIKNCCYCGSGPCPYSCEGH